ncbi:MAG: hypothetical protein K0R08_618 [Solimicrobium sp.]|jgi:TPR repeat protein|nr:hypothetical protein [Solimicrobium sp.]
MQPISRSVNNTHFGLDLSNSSSTKKNDIVNPHVISIKSRIEENRLLLDELKTDPGFQNILALLRYNPHQKKSFTSAQILNFLIGKASLEECYGKNDGKNGGWTDNYLKAIHPFDKLEFDPGWFGNQGSHFLNKTLADKLATIFKHGYSESIEKTDSKMNIFLDAMDNSGKVMLAKKEIDYALSMVENGRPEKAIEICKGAYENVVKDRNQFDIQKIKYKILDASLEILLFGDEKTAIAFLHLAVSLEDVWWKYTWHAGRCFFRMLTELLPIGDQEMFYVEGAIDNFDLECTPYFLGKAYEEGLYGVRKNAVEAKKFFEIAHERGYKPGRLLLMREQGEDYKLMLAAMQNKKSIFFHMPRELVNHIGRLHVEATLAQSELERNRLICK